MTTMTTTMTGTATDLTRRGECRPGTFGVRRSGRAAGLSSAGVTARSDDGSSSARDGRVGDAGVPRTRVAPADGSPANHRPGSGIPPPRTAHRPPGPPPRPRIVDEPGILGLSRLTRGRFGSRLFNLFFLLVFTVILIQMVSSILDNTW
jgi:hypothetical protein